MADDKKNIPEAAPPAEAPAPAVENAAVPEQPSPGPALTDAEAVMLEHEGQAALFEMGEAVPDPADAVTHAEVEEPAAPEVPKAEKEQAQPPDPGKDAPAPAHSGKVVDFAAARDEAAKEEKKAVKQKPPTEKDKAAKPGRGRPPKDGKAAPDKAKPPKPRDKKSQSKPAPEKPAVDKGGAPAGAEVTPEPTAPRDATRAEKEEIVYLNLSDLHPFKNHPFGVRDDVEMQGLVESVKAAGVNQPALVRPREDGGYRKCSKTHYIRLDFLEQVVLYEVKRLACFASEYENDFIKAMIGRSAKVAENTALRKQRELDALTARDRELDMLFERLYEDNVAGKIDDARFAKMSKRYEQEQGENAKKIKALRLELKKDESKRMDIDDFLETVRRYTDATTITKRMVAELIDHIEVYHAEKQDGITNQRVDIHYNCIGAFDVPDRRKIPEADIIMETRKGVALSYAPEQVAV